MSLGLKELEKMELSEKIYFLRKEKGMTQGALAKNSGVSIAEICRIEKGERKNPSINLLNKILFALEVDSQTYLKVLGFKENRK